MKKIFITLSFIFILSFICNVTSNAIVSENLKYTTTDYPLDVPSYTIEVIGNGPAIISEV